jgi:hypothetical protein
MFIRIKNINKHDYAYLVENKWTKKGTRQKTKGYLGKVIPLGDIPHSTSDVNSTTLDDFFTKSLLSLLEGVGFIITKHCAEKDDILIDIKKRSVTRKDKKCVLQVNQGFMCNYTLKEIFQFSTRKYVNKLQTDNKNVGLKLANSLVGVGLLLDEETFIELYAKLVPNE